MKFKIFMRDWGYFMEADAACTYNLKRVDNGWIGWVDTRLLEELQAHFDIRVLY